MKLIILFFVLALTQLISCDGTDNDQKEPKDNLKNTQQILTLEAAAGKAILTPNQENHPETIYLGGIYPARKATGVHDDLLASVLILKQKEEHIVIVSLDFLGFTRTRGREIQERLSEFGINKNNVFIAATHTHEAPDTVGVFGPSITESGVSPTYMKFVQDTIVDLVADTWKKLVPVKMKAIKKQINDPDSTHSTLIADLRKPDITVDYMTAAAFIDENDKTVATLVNWHSHPEVMIGQNDISSDFAHYLRNQMQKLMGGTCVYISGAVGGLSTPTGVAVSARDENGDPMLDENSKNVYLKDASWEKTRSMGYLIAEIAHKELESATIQQDPKLVIHVEQLLIPVDNMLMQMAFSAELVEYEEKDLVQNEELCGWFGCAAERLGMMTLGNIVLTTSPGETFPETVVGRKAETIDFGGEWGEFTFPAIDGIDNHIPEDRIPMHLGLSDDEIGYIIPKGDFHPKEHPDYYEEELYFGENSEEIYRKAVINMLEKYL